MLEKRFAIQQDGVGLWSVVDAESGSTPIVQGRTLAKMSEGEAHDAATLLNLVAGIRDAGRRAPATAHPGLQPFLQPIR